MAYVMGQTTSVLYLRCVGDLSPTAGDEAYEGIPTSGVIITVILCDPSVCKTFGGAF
jgi:hypothetical protein